MAADTNILPGYHAMEMIANIGHCNFVQKVKLDLS